MEALNDRLEKEKKAHADLNKRRTRFAGHDTSIVKLSPCEASFAEKCKRALLQTMLAHIAMLALIAIPQIGSPHQRLSSPEVQHRASISTTSDSDSSSGDIVNDAFDNSHTSTANSLHSNSVSYVQIIQRKVGPMEPPLRNMNNNIEKKTTKRKDSFYPLIGAKHEKMVQMYVQNIEVDAKEETMDIEHKVKTHTE